MLFSQQLPNIVLSPYHKPLPNLAHIYFFICIFYFFLCRLYSNPRNLFDNPRILKPSILRFSHLLFPISGKFFAQLFQVSLSSFCSGLCSSILLSKRPSLITFIETAPSCYHYSTLSPCFIFHYCTYHYLQIHYILIYFLSPKQNLGFMSTEAIYFTHC